MTRRLVAGWLLDELDVGELVVGWLLGELVVGELVVGWLLLEGLVVGELIVATARIAAAAQQRAAAWRWR